jgi:hypothetical protein
MEALAISLKTLEKVRADLKYKGVRQKEEASL